MLLRMLRNWNPQVKYKVTILPGNSTPNYISKRPENTSPCENLYVNAQSGALYNSHKLETIQRPIK